MRNLWTVVGVIAAIVIAWVLVEVVFKLAWFAVKLGFVALVAVVVFFVLRAVFARSRG
jgi:hypothetical protein